MGVVGKELEMRNHKGDKIGIPPTGRDAGQGVSGVFQGVSRFSGASGGVSGGVGKLCRKRVKSHQNVRSPSKNRSKRSFIDLYLDIYEIQGLKGLRG